ncbi:shikimate kinase [Tenacibaculum sp. SG-28]|uniref:shikimate kinase n=1 Tax=Tenacibaculum sp. SG-28 TaxID=754426 RepID=UPI000CF4CFA8|nr:shikimate kinase [Tenacibaculum sp. SG-28]PQJ23359.1 shikimate kinase [Tenacibaculum sp. SG-28]
MKIILLGYMSCGKSSIGKMAANVLDYPFIDLDTFIEKQEKQTVKDIFKYKGEVYFRTIESKYLKELLASDDDFLLSLGGGTPCYANNMDAILNTQNTRSIYLKANINTLVSRLSKEKAQRPLVASLNNLDLHEFIAKHLFERNLYYLKANFTIHVDSKSIEEVTKELTDLLI